MKLAIMQPYLFPYIGYFQLIHAVDMFVLYDDVQYIKNGWINRNRYLLNGEEKLITFGVKNDELKTKINEVTFSNKYDYEKRKFIKTIEQNYAKAPNFSLFFPILLDILNYEENNVSKFIGNSLNVICDFLGINTMMLLSSDIKKNDDLTGQEKVININKCLNAKAYINPIGGIELYSKSRFAVEGIDLYFLKPNPIEYKQFNFDLKPWLSIVDVLMFNTTNVVKDYLKEYKLL